MEGWMGTTQLDYLWNYRVSEIDALKLLSETLFIKHEASERLLMPSLLFVPRSQVYWKKRKSERCADGVKCSAHYWLPLLFISALLKASATKRLFLLELLCLWSSTFQTCLAFHSFMTAWEKKKYITCLGVSQSLKGNG